MTYLTTSGQVTYSFPMDYLKKAFIKAKLDGKALVYGTDYTITDSQKQLVLAKAPIAGLELTISRKTGSERLVSFNDASIFKASDMTLNQVQQLHILEESQENIDNAVNTSHEADSKADKALQTSEQAHGLATEALDAAKQAVITSDNALSNTLVALDNSEQALSTANGVNSKAQQALDNSEDAVERVEDIEKVIGSIALGDAQTLNGQSGVQIKQEVLTNVENTALQKTGDYMRGHISFPVTDIPTQSTAGVHFDQNAIYQAYNNLYIDLVEGKQLVVHRQGVGTLLSVAGTSVTDADVYIGHNQGVQAQLNNLQTNKIGEMDSNRRVQGNFAVLDGDLNSISNGLSSSLEVQNFGGGAAKILLHRVNGFACFIGVDTDNKFKIGGGSFGNVAYEIPYIVAQDLGETGYIKWSNGVIEQWGHSTNGAGGRGTVTFPESFNSVVHFAGGWAIRTSGGISGSNYPYNVSLTGFNIVIDSTEYYWYAKGV